MCRLLLVKSNREFEIAEHLKQFSLIAKNSPEYQGDGWGIAIYKNHSWEVYKNTLPIWEDELNNFGRANLILAHVRSAFKGSDISLLNTMPFVFDNYAFIFNGELHGVRIKETGNSGAEKIFNLIRKMDRGDGGQAVEQTVRLISQKSNYIKAMNFIVAKNDKIYLNSIFNENQSYFMMHKKIGNSLIISSVPYPTTNHGDWSPIHNLYCGEI